MVLTRPALPADVTAVTDLVSRAFTHYTERIGTEPGPMHFDYHHLINVEQVWVAEVEGLIVGTIVLIPEPDHLEIEVLAVSPEAQGAGIGAALLDFAASRARDLGLQRLQLHTNEHMTENIRYYPRQGFTETHRAMEDGYRRVFYTKAL